MDPFSLTSHSSTYSCNPNPHALLFGMSLQSSSHVSDGIDISLILLEHVTQQNKPLLASECRPGPWECSDLHG